MTNGHSSVSNCDGKQSFNKAMHKNWQFDEARKIWLWKFLNVDPHSPTTHTLKTTDITFAYDLGYRQALLIMRLELESMLASVKSREALETSGTTSETPSNSSNCDDINKLIKRTSEKIETSYQVHNDMSDEKVDRIARCKYDAQSSWWNMK